MNAAEETRAVAAGVATASALGLKVDDAVVVHNSNRIAVRLLPCGTLARVAPIATDPISAPFEVEVARRLAETESPVAEIDPRVAPRVYERDGFAITLWTYFEPVLSDVTPREYAQALERLHEGMRPIDLTTPHFTDRVAEAQQLVDTPADTPELPDADRELLSNALRSLSQTIVERSATEQLLHGEPHAGNVLRTKRGLLFTDLQTVCRGPIEFDIAHCSPFDQVPGTSWYLSAQLPELVGTNYPGADLELVRMCWVLMLAMVAAWRWDRRDQFPDGRQMGIAFVSELRTALDRYGLDIQG